VVASGGEYCDKCKRRNPIAFRVEPEATWRTVVLNRWRKLCPSCFDVLEDSSGEEPEWDEIAAPMHDRLADLTNELVRTNAITPRELAFKTTALLDWLDPHDLPGLLSASLCRDILLLFPAKA
jgi:hypothetical protein